MDEAAFRGVNGRHGPSADRFFGAITELGSIWASGAAAAALVVTGNRRTAARAFAAAALTWTLGQALKRAVMRPRPYEADPDSTRLMIGKPNGTSWPSSHPAVLLAFTTVAGRDLGLRLPVRGALRSLAAAVGVSRTYLGVHYPSDVLGGLLLGRAVGLAWPTARR